MKIYTPDSNKIVHTTSVDFKKRGVNKPIHVVQYDNSLPVIAVKLYLDGEVYALSSEAEANVRLKKRDGTVVYNPVLGCNSDRNIVYFEVTYQMTSVNGRTAPVLEICYGNDQVASSSPIEMEIDRNPIQEGDVASTDEVETIRKYLSDVENYAEIASDSASSALAYKNAAATSESNAKTSETNAKSSEDSASDSASSALASKNAAATSESNAKTSETNAKTSETNAKTSETNAKTSETNAKNSELKALEYATLLGETGVGSLSDSFAKKKITLFITDSNNEALLDSSGNVIESISYFVDEQTVENLENRMSAIETILLDLIRNFSYVKANLAIDKVSELSDQCGQYFAIVDENTNDISKLKQNSILDSNYN